jgi:hypothetical protein
MRHVYANLMRSAGLQIHRDAAVMAKALRQTIMGYSMFAPRNKDRHFLALSRMATHGRIHCASTRHRADA